MRYVYFLVVPLAVLCSTLTGFGLAVEQIGPDKDQSHQTTEQPGWPAGLVDILRHDARVYSVRVNGNTNYYFKAAPAELEVLIAMFAKTRLRDHVVTIKQGTPEVKPFNVPKGIPYNVHLHHLEGIALVMTRREAAEAKTYDPALTIHVGPDDDLAVLKKIAIPAGVIVHSELPEWPGTGELTVPERKLWHAEVHFEGGKPAVDFEGGVTTAVTLWEKDEEEPISLGQVDHEGFFRAAFSEKEMADLEADRAWLTLTVGNYLTKPARDHPRLPAGSLAPSREAAKPVVVAQPGYYYGRILFDDGSPAIFDPEPWPGGQVSLSFPFAGRAELDQEGYFRLYFTPAQFEELKERKASKNVYVPIYGKRGRSTALHAYPPELLSREKETAGELKIARPEAEAEKE